MTFSRNKAGKLVYLPMGENRPKGKCEHTILITTGAEWDMSNHMLGSAQAVDCLCCGSTRVMNDNYCPRKDQDVIRRIDYHVEKTVIYGFDGSTQIVYLKKGHEGDEF